jgi:hypothetical protein
MTEMVIERLDGPAVLVSFVFLMLVWRAFTALNQQLIAIVKESTTAMHELTSAFKELREEVRRNK